MADGTQVQLAARDGSIIITPVSSKYALEDLVEGITTENCHTETDWGELRGAETW